MARIEGGGQGVGKARTSSSFPGRRESSHMDDVVALRRLSWNWAPPSRRRRTGARLRVYFRRLAMWRPTIRPTRPMPNSAPSVGSGIEMPLDCAMAGATDSRTAKRDIPMRSTFARPWLMTPRSCQTARFGKIPYNSWLMTHLGTQDRAGSPAARRAACASAIECVPKWKIEAASTALAWPWVTPSTR